MGTIPVLDLRDLDAPPGPAGARFAGALREALCELGFVAVEGHGIDPQLVGRVVDHFERFFSLSEARKRDCAGGEGGQRGFTGFGIEHAKDRTQPDLKEFFHVGQEAGASAGYPGNVWPRGSPGLRRDALALFGALEACAMRLLEALAESFALPRRVFASMLVDGNSILRALHYPPVTTCGPAGGIRAAAHEDINLITLLCGATASGLEIRPPGSDRWLAVEGEPGQIVVDSGDMLSRLTNDVVPATTHRVVNPPAGDDRHRYALPFFAHPRPECDLSVLPAFVSEERPRRHPPITAGAYLSERLHEIGLLP